MVKEQELQKREIVVYIFRPIRLISGDVIWKNVNTSCKGVVKVAESKNVIAKKNSLQVLLTTKVFSLKTKHRYTVYIPFQSFECKN